MNTPQVIKAKTKYIGWNLKVKPGIDTLTDDLEVTRNYFKPLL